jgi:O-antigen/teichoic acid export membrane protein
MRMIAAVSTRFLGRFGWNAEKPAGAPAAGAGEAQPSAARGGFGGRFAVVLSGELIQSLFHFVLNIALVRTLSQQDYGFFAIIFVVGAIALTYARAGVAVPATTFIARAQGRLSERAFDALFGTAAFVLALAVMLVVSMALLPIIGAGAWAAGSFVALYAFRSYQRIVLLARKAPRIAGLSDLVYAAVGIGSILYCTLGLDHVTPTHAFLSLTLAHASGVLVSFVRLGQPVRLTFKRKLWRRYLAIWRSLAWSLAGITTNTLQGQGITIAFAAIVGPSDYAPIAATLVLFAPLRIPTNALTNMALAEVTELLAKGRVDLARQIVVRSNIVIAAGCLVYGGAMLLTLPLIERYLFGGRFDHEPMGWIAAGIWMMMLLSLLYAIPRAFLEATGTFRAIAWGSGIGLVISYAIMVPLLLTMPSAFAILGLIASEGFVLIWLLRVYRRVSRVATDAASPVAGAAQQA